MKFIYVRYIEMYIIGALIISDEFFDELYTFLSGISKARGNDLWISDMIPN